MCGSIRLTRRTLSRTAPNPSAVERRNYLWSFVLDRTFALLGSALRILPTNAAAATRANRHLSVVYL